jgi:hypothetical protein
MAIIIIRMATITIHRDLRIVHRQTITTTTIIALMLMTMMITTVRRNRVDRHIITISSTVGALTSTTVAQRKTRGNSNQYKLTMSLITVITITALHRRRRNRITMIIDPINRINRTLLPTIDLQISLSMATNRDHTADPRLTKMAMDIMVATTTTHTRRGLILPRIQLVVCKTVFCM